MRSDRKKMHWGGPDAVNVHVICVFVTVDWSLTFSHMGIRLERKYGERSNIIVELVSK